MTSGLSTFWSGRTVKKQSADPIDTTAAQSRARSQPKCVATYAETMGESQPPRLPNVFIKPESEPVNCSVTSMHVAQKVVAANMLRPAPKASNEIASRLVDAAAPNQSRMADPIMPMHTASRLPARLPTRRTARSENQPPKGAKIAMAIYGVEPQIPPCAM